METQAIREAAVQHGIVPEAIEDVVDLVKTRFAGEQPSPAAVETYLRALPTWTKVGMSKEEFYEQPLAWRHSMGHQYAPPSPAVHSRRPVYRTLIPEECATLDGLPWAERLTRGREMQQTPAPQP